MSAIETLIQDATTRQQARAEIWTALRDAFLIESVDLNTHVPLNARDRVVDEFVEILYVRAPQFVAQQNP